MGGVGGGAGAGECSTIIPFRIMGFDKTENVWGSAGSLSNAAAAAALTKMEDIRSKSFSSFEGLFSDSSTWMVKMTLPASIDTSTRETATSICAATFSAILA